jgi:lipopolysaccharide transport system permease protein
MQQSNVPEIIRSSQSALRSPGRFLEECFADLLACREVAWELFTKSLRSQFRQSVLGYVWLMLPSLAIVFTWTMLIDFKIFNVGIKNPPYPLYLLASMTFWSLFVESIQCPMQQIASSKDIMAKVKVPHEALLISGIAAILFNFTVRMLVVLGCIACFGRSVNPGLLIVPVGAVFIMALGLSAGLFIAPLGVLYADINRALDLFLGFAFFATPIVYAPLTTGPAAHWLAMNPLAVLVNGSRNTMLLLESTPPEQFWVVGLLCLCAFVVSWLFYRITIPHFVSRV